MRSLTVLSLVLAVFFSVSQAASDCAPAPFNDTTIYNVCEFSNPEKTVVNMTNTTEMTNGTLNISLTRNVVPCNNSNITVLAVLRYIKTTATGSETVCQDVQYSVPSVNLFDEDKVDGGLQFVYNTNLTDAVRNVDNVAVIVDLVCETDGVDKSSFDTGVYDVANKTIKVAVKSKNSCPNKYLSKLAYYFMKYKPVFITVFILIGLFICFAGLAAVKITIFMVAAIAATLGSGLLFVGLISYSASGVTFWLIFAVCVVIGCVVGWIAVKIEKFGFAALGLALGVVVGEALFAAIFASVGAKTAVYWVVIVICGLVGCILAFKFYKSFVIIATSVIGSFLVVKNIGGAIGNFPSAESMAQGFDHGIAVYFYLAGFILLAVAGMYVQHKRKKATEDAEAETDVHGYQRVMGYNNA